ncbi:MAG: AMP-binding protein, partial [Alphaproteobacteria bacterium]
MLEPMWQPSAERASASNLAAFIDWQQTERRRIFSNYAELHSWSVSNQPAFWSDFWDWAGIISEKKGERILIDAEKMPGASYFPDARLNFAENLLRHCNEQPALIFRREDGLEKTMSGNELVSMAGQVSRALVAMGIQPGDRIAGFLPNIPEAIAIMAGAAAIGATWTSCSPDFGVQGVLDRFGQVQPKVMVT